jgi:protein-L-isoaspartate(D-aspartate) O-methyltransferase
MARKDTTFGAATGSQPHLRLSLPAISEELAMDFPAARARMVDSQLRPNGITDERLIAAMATVPRELFVPPAQRYLAYADEDLMVSPPEADARPRYLIEPMTLARMVQLLAPGTDDLVLDVGCATGYSSAILAALAGNVVALESDPRLAAQAAANLAELGVANVKVVEGDLSLGHPPDGPYGGICINGRVPGACLPLLSQLKEHGRLCTVVGDHNIGRIALFTRNGAFGVRYAFDAAVPALPGFPAAPPVFAF